MKRFLVILLSACIITLGGCAIPVGNTGSAKADIGATAEKTGNLPAESAGAPTAAGAGTAQKTAETTPAAAEDKGVPEGGSAATEAAAARMPVTLYYQDGDGYLIPLTRWIEKQQGIARAAVNGLIDSALTREELQYYGVYPVLPVNTDVLGINIKDRVAVIDFNKSLLGYADEVSERNMVASVVYTLTEFSTIDSVRILINGYPQKALKFGTDISEPLSRKNVSINTAGIKVGDGSAKADVYCFKRANEGFVYLLPVSVEYGAAGEELKPETLVNLLLKEKADKRLESEMPAGAKLIDSREDGRTLTLNFDGAFVKYGGNAREEGILKQLAYTLKQLKGHDRIKILVEGSPAELPEGTDISRGLAIPSTINDYIDR